MNREKFVLAGEKVLMSVGRKPVIKGIGIENIRVLCEGDTIKQLVFSYPTVSRNIT